MLCGRAFGVSALRTHDPMSRPVPRATEETVSGTLLLTVEQFFCAVVWLSTGPRPSVNPEVFSGPDIGTYADGALETRCSKLSSLDASASHHVQLCRLRAGAGRQRNTVLMYSPGFVRATKSQVGSAQDSRSLERAVAGLRATLHASILAVPREVWESMLAGDPE